MRTQLLTKPYKTSRYLRVPREAHAIAILLATVVYGVAVANLCIALYFVVAGSGLLVSLFAATLVFMMVWFWAPRFGKLPDDAVQLEAHSLPELYEVIEEICFNYGIDVPEVWLTGNFTAGYARIGLCRQPTLLLGYSMLAILERDELLTLLAHELAHACDGAVTRSLYVSNVASALYAAKVGSYSIAKKLDQFVLMKPLAWAFFLVAAFSAEIGRYLQRQISKDYRHAEYVADYCAFTISGQRDISTLLLKLSSGMLSSIQAACAKVESTEKYAAIHTAFNAISEREKRNIWAYVMAEPNHPYARHPRSVERIALLSHFPDVTPKVILAPEQFSNIQGELRRWIAGSTIQ